MRPNWTVNEPRGRVVRIERLTRDSVTLTLKPNKAFAGFRPGQFVQVGVEIDGVRRTRCYSPAGSAHDPQSLELTVKTHADGLVSRHLAENARVGMVVALSAADGDFHLPAARPDHLLLISGGSGITPVLSMLRTLCDEGHLGPIDFVHYAPSAADALYRDELERIARRHPNVRLLRSYTRQPGAGELDGHFGGTHLARPRRLRRRGDLRLRAARAARRGPRELGRIGPGPAPARRELRARPRSRSAPTSRRAPSPTPRAGQTVPNDGRTLLEQAEAAGLRPEFGCRMGICHTCSCRKTAGSVRNAITGEVSAAEDEEIRICVSVPVGDVQIEL